MEKEKNPFVVSGHIDPPYFCDRVDEQAALRKAIDNGRNLVLISPRRMGKTGLVRHCFEYALEPDGYYTFFIDIFHTTSLQELTYQLGRKIYEAIVPRGKKMLTAFLQTLRSISGQFGFDPATGLPTFSLSLGDITQPELTLDEIFRYLDQADKPCIVAIDEFQQIANYPEKNIEALLRTHVQAMRNCQFIFAGSEYHVMQEMFLSGARPFYNSADIMELKAIDQTVYTDFVKTWMDRYGRTVTDAQVAAVYRLFRGNTYGMQRTFNEVFALMQSGDICTKTILLQAVRNIIESKAPFFEEQLSHISEKQKPLLFAVAQEGTVTQITAAAFIQKHRLASASSVQHAAKQLVSAGILSKLHGEYAVNEQFFDLWLQQLYGYAPLEQKIGLDE